MKFLLEIVLTGLAVYIAANLMPGVYIHGFFTALKVGIVLGLINATLGALIKLITLPVNILTLGLLSFFINALMVLLVSNLVHGFYVRGLFHAGIFALVLAVLKMLFHGMAKSSKED